MTARSCGTCQWADATVLDDDDLALQCRRWPPQITVLDDGPIQCWPQVTADDWCAEHTPTEETELRRLPTAAELIDGYSTPTDGDPT